MYFYICYSLLAIWQIVSAGDWSNWGRWSECSASCGGGLSSQRRQCYDRTSHCSGNDVRYKHCNIEPCVGELLDRNDRLCKDRRKLPNGVQETNWAPISQQEYQCFTLCNDQSRTFPGDIKVNIEDGTMCGSDPNFYCIDGRCIRVGCDGIPWSNQILDKCGICGGNGTCYPEVPEKSQKQKYSKYHWMVDWSPCTVTCGIGYQRSKAECKNIGTNQKVQDYFCDVNRKPETVYKECRSSPCGARWKVTHYGPCSAPCGGGNKRRQISCEISTGRNGIIRVSPYRCPDPIPVTEIPCNLQFCPASWEIGPWTSCSVTCGIGLQTRKVFCVKYPVYGRKINVSNSECFGPRPQTSRTCSNPVCYQSISFLPTIEIDNSTFIQIKRTKRVNLNVGGRATLLPRQPVKIKCNVKNFDRKMILWTRNRRLISISPLKRVHVTHNGVLRIKRTDPNLDQGVFTCLAGMEKASVYLDFQNKKKAKVTAKHIMKNKEYDIRAENLIDKPQSDNVPAVRGPLNKDDKQSNIIQKHSAQTIFLNSDWTECSRTCGIGLQTRKVTCNIISDSYIKVVSDENCLTNNIEKPVNVRKCILQELCPKWRVGDWGLCSDKFCKRDGIAIQQRELVCEDGNGSAIQSDNCKNLQRPLGKQECRNSKCVSVWLPSKWTECKPRCGRRGKTTRSLTCVWRDSKKPARANCSTKARPAAWKSCKPKPCRKGCTDHSRYCSLIAMLKMCRYQQFHFKCCKSCKQVNEV